MFSTDDLVYFRVRALEERLSAARCHNPRAEAAHIALARRYADRAKRLDDTELPVEPLQP